MEGDNDGFVFVKDKRKCFRQKTYVNENDKARMYSMHSETNKSPDVSLQRKLVARIESARKEINAARQFDSIIQHVQKFLDIKHNIDSYGNSTDKDVSGASDVVCLGIGKLKDSSIACYQLALLLAMLSFRHNTMNLRHQSTLDKAQTSSQMQLQHRYIYDPILDVDECEVLRSSYGFKIMTENIGGKWLTKPGMKTLMYLPHCGAALYNNMLWGCWSRDKLVNVAIIGNSLEAYRFRPPRLNSPALAFIKAASKLAEELQLPHHDTCPHAFTDTSFITFPMCLNEDEVPEIETTLSQVDWDMEEPRDTNDGETYI